MRYSAKESNPTIRGKRMDLQLTPTESHLLSVNPLKDKHDRMASVILEYMPGEFSQSLETRRWPSFHSSLSSTATRSSQSDERPKSVHMASLSWIGARSSGLCEVDFERRHALIPWRMSPAEPLRAARMAHRCLTPLANPERDMGYCRGQSMDEEAEEPYQDEFLWVEED